MTPLSTTSRSGSGIFALLLLSTACSSAPPAEHASNDTSSQRRPRYEIRCDARPDCEAQAQRLCPRGYTDQTAAANVEQLNDGSAPRHSSSMSGASDFRLSGSGVQRIVIECNERNF